MLATKVNNADNKKQNLTTKVKEHIIKTFERTKIAKYLAEFVGTFYLLFYITLSGGLNGQHAAFAIGFALVVLVYKFGYISGAHFNPAITIGVVCRGGADNFAANDYGQIIMYLLSQCFGAILGSGVGTLVGGHVTCNVYPQISEYHNIAQAFFGEFFCTLFLVSTVLHVSTKQKGNDFYGMSVGFSLLISIISMSPITGSAVNPAVWLGRTISIAFCEKTNAFGSAAYYWVSELLAGIVAGYSFRLINHTLYGSSASESDKPEAGSNSKNNNNNENDDDNDNEDDKNYNGGNTNNTNNTNKHHVIQISNDSNL